MLIATASETSGPPSMPSTQSLIVSNAGSAATTAPKPTRLATLRIGSTEALTPASMVERNVGSRRKFTAISTTIAADSAVITDQTPPTAESEVAPQSSSFKKEVSRRGSTANDISRLTAITVTSGSAANANGGRVGA